MFPVLPFRSELYRPDELFAGLTEDDPTSYALTPDFRAYRSTKLEANREVGMLRALHDQSITEQRTALLAGHRIVAIMGGHALARDDPAYRQVAELARMLARAEFVVVSGGGPGAMEATHLGALLAPLEDERLDSALDRLAQVPNFPDTTGLVADGGAVNRYLLAELHRWQVPALSVRGSVAPARRGRSLAIPTWFYGHEPPTVFASHIAKYFSNPLREDGLLSIAVDGVIYAPGHAGTVQEVFQDAAQNGHRVVDGRFSPMAFLDTAGHWSERVPLLPVLEALLEPVDLAKSVAVSADIADPARFLERWPAHPPPGVLASGRRADNAGPDGIHR